MFPIIEHISDLKNRVEDKKAIHQINGPLNSTFFSYKILESTTFDDPYARECRGITFDQYGEVVSRPLHKFFSLDEREETQSHLIAQLHPEQIDSYMEKLDGSMIASALLDGQLYWHTKNDFNARSVQRLRKWLATPGHEHIVKFTEEMAHFGYTCIFEFVDPDNKMVVNYDKVRFALLHVRSNIMGEYAMLNPNHFVHKQIRGYGIDVVERKPYTSLDDLVASLALKKNFEGVVLQFKTGDMVKIKTEWFNKVHKLVSYLYERDIAKMALEGTLDDAKAALKEIGVPMAEINEIEDRVFAKVEALKAKVKAQVAEARKTVTDPRTAAMFFKGDDNFNLLLKEFREHADPGYEQFYLKHYWKDDFTLRSLTGAIVGMDSEGTRQTVR